MKIFLYFGCGQLAGRADACPEADFSPLTIGDKCFIDTKSGLHVETAQSALIVILKLVISGLTSIILIVFDIVNLQFQGQFVSISLKLVLTIVAGYVMATVWPSCN